jgi:exodeoxyribonuclease VII large subunit
VVIRAIAASRVPVISAVGHQIDHPLSDDVADASAPTPSAAAEILIPDVRELHNEVSYYLTRSERALLTRLERVSDRLDSLTSRRVFTDPMQLLTMRQMWLAEVENRMKYSLTTSLNSARNRLQNLPDITWLENKILESSRYRYRLALQKLENMSPLAVLERGYTIVRNREGEIIRNVRSMEKGDQVTLTMQDGSARGIIESTKPEEV